MEVCRCSWDVTETSLELLTHLDKNKERMQYSFRPKGAAAKSSCSSGGVPRLSGTLVLFGSRRQGANLNPSGVDLDKIKNMLNV